MTDNLYALVDEMESLLDRFRNIPDPEEDMFLGISSLDMVDGDCKDLKVKIYSHVPYKKFNLECKLLDLILEDLQMLYEFDKEDGVDPERNKAKMLLSMLAKTYADWHMKYVNMEDEKILKCSVPEVPREYLKSAFDLNLSSLSGLGK